MVRKWTPVQAAAVFLRWHFGRFDENEVMNFHRSTVKAKEQFKVFYLSSKFVQCAPAPLSALCPRVLTPLKESYCGCPRRGEHEQAPPRHRRVKRRMEDVRNPDPETLHLAWHLASGSGVGDMVGKGPSTRRSIAPARSHMRRQRLGCFRGYAAGVRLMGLAATPVAGGCVTRAWCSRERP